MSNNRDIHDKDYSSDTEFKFKNAPRLQLGSLTGYLVPGYVGYNQEDSFIITGFVDDSSDQNIVEELGSQPPIRYTDDELDVDKFMRQYGYPPLDSDSEERM